VRVLFVCTGNLCRSPMAAALLRAELEAREVEDVEVESAGTWAIDGSPATHDAIGTLAGLGIDLRGHRSKHLSRSQLTRADLIVAMTTVHVREIAEVDMPVRMPTASAGPVTPSAARPAPSSSMCFYSSCIWPGGAGLLGLS
jgi:protein-tyrosine-phosphatase